jgi:WHG domain-containing protein
MTRDASVTVMNRRPQIGRGRRNFTLDDLLTDTESGSTHRIALDLASEIERQFGKVASLSEARAFCTQKSSRELRRRIEYATEGKNGADSLRAVAHAMRDYALDSPGLSAACFRSIMNDCEKWSADDELARTLSGVLAGLNLAGEEAQHVVRALRIFVHGFVLEEMALSSAESLEYEKTYELMINAFIRGLLVSTPKSGEDERRL